MNRSLSLLACAALLVAGALPAATITVDSESEAPVSGKCTLREAVVAANTNTAVGTCSAGAVGLDNIVFAATVANITFTQPLPSTIDALRVTEALVLDGTAGSGVVALRRDTALDDSTPFRLIEVVDPVAGNPDLVDSAPLTLVGIALHNGLAAPGGGLLTRGPLTMQDSIVEGCRAVGDDGGGVAQIRSGALDLLRVLFDGNTVSLGNGGGVFTKSDAVSIRDSTFGYNESDNGEGSGPGGNGGNGGGLHNYGDVITITGSSFYGNFATNHGGGMEVGGATLLDNVTVSGNQSGYYSGAGIYLAASGTIPPGRSTVSAINNSTIVNNYAGTQATATAYSGGLFYANHSSKSGVETGLGMNSTLLAGNTAHDGSSTTPRDLGASYATILPGSHNLSYAFSAGGSNYKLDLDAIDCDPMLAALADNGGPTPTHALQTGSCAIDAGSNPDGLTTDQRGSGYPRVLGAAADIGAYEGASAAPTLPQVQFTVATASVGEGDGNIVLVVHRSGDTSAASQVDYASADGIASAGADYTAVSGTLNWAGGDTADKNINVPILEDSVIEGNETFSVLLSNPSGATLGAATAQVTITDNDRNGNPPPVTVAPTPVLSLWSLLILGVLTLLVALRARARS